MSRRLPVRNKSDEMDVITGWRRYLIWRPGDLAAIKRRLRRRERHHAKAALRRGDYW